MSPSKNPSRADNQQVSKKFRDDYFVGFVDGEGCFYVGFSKRKDLPIPWQIITEFHVSQNPGSRNVLEALRDRLGCGYLKPNHAKSNTDKTWILIVKDRKDLLEKVIPFFEKYPLHSTKYKDFIVFKEVLQIIKEGRHLNSTGFSEIIELVFSLDRQTKKRYTKEMILSSYNLRDYMSDPPKRRGRYSPNSDANRRV